MAYPSPYALLLRATSVLSLLSEPFTLWSFIREDAVHQHQPSQGTDEQLPKCQHSRLLEGIQDSQGNPTDTLKCCECGALVPRTRQHSRLS